MTVHQIGVISDTHGLLRPEALTALQGVELILHAGDVGKPEVLAALQTVAPVLAVRGNVDRGAWAEALPETQTTQVDEAWIYILHDRDRLDLDPAAGGFAAVISGHSHRASVTTKAGVLYLNPGAAGPRRFTLPVTLARVEIERARHHCAEVGFLIVRLSAFTCLFNEPVDQAAGDCEGGRDTGELVGGEPTGVRQLAFLELELTSRVLGGEADHQRVGEGPRLAAEVADVAEVDPHLLAHLAGGAFLQGLPRLDVARQDAETTGRKAMVPREQNV